MMCGVAAIVVVGAAAAVAPASAQSSADTSLVTIVHGLRGQLVDVSLDGTLLLPAFQPDRLTDPTPVSAGPHVVTLRPAGTATTEAPKLEQTVDVPAGKSLALVAHYNEDGSWGLAAFANNVAPTGSQGRVVFRNTAAVPAVDVQLNGSTVAPSLDQGAEHEEDLPAATYTVAVQAESQTTPLVPADDVAVAEGSANFLYLVGQGNDVTWLSQRVDGLQAAPTRVSTGDSGLLDGSRPVGDSTPWAIGAGLTLALLAGCVGLVATRRRTPMS
jgi:hypothetical protein